MSNRMNYRRPVHQIHDRELENKYRERRSAWISTRVLMKAKRWQDIVDWNAEREYETARANGPAKYAKS